MSLYVPTVSDGAVNIDGPKQPRPGSGHVFRVEGRCRPVWRAKYRLPDGRQVQRTIGPAWTARGRPPSSPKQMAAAIVRTATEGPLSPCMEAVAQRRPKSFGT